MTCIKCNSELPEQSLYCNYCGKKQLAESRRALKRPNGTGTVYKRNGRRKKPWAAEKNGIHIGYYGTKTEALDALAQLSSKNLSERYNMSFKEVYKDWSLEHFRDIGENGKASYETAFSYFSDLHDKSFRTLRVKDYQPLIDTLIDKGRKHDTVSKYKQLLTQMSKWAMREELITTNYASFIKIPEKIKTDKMLFTEDDIKKLENSKDDAAKIILMLLSTGMRIGELFSLPLCDVYEKHVIGGEKTKTGRNRIIPIRPEGRVCFEYFKSLSRGKTLLLDGYEGNHDIANFRKREYYPLLESLKIERKTPHATRHTYASRAVDEGTPRELLQKILGHASYELTADVYVHSDLEKLIAAVEPPATFDGNLTVTESKQG